MQGFLITMSRLPQELDEMFSRFQAQNPEPKGELESKNVYTLLVAVVLSAQMTDKGVNKATRVLFDRVTTPEDMIRLGEERLKEIIKSVGLYPTKAKNIMKLSQILVDHYESQVPNDRRALESLPGVGHKTASVLLNSAFGVPCIAVDTHVFRVSHRLNLSEGKTRQAVEAELNALIPERWLQHAHHWLILHGRYTCTAKKPKCPTCILRDLCPYPQKTGHDL